MKPNNMRKNWVVVIITLAILMICAGISIDSYAMETVDTFYHIDAMGVYGALPTYHIVEYESVNEYIYVDTDLLNLRQSTNFQSTVLDVLHRGEGVEAREKLSVLNTDTFEPEVWYHVWTSRGVDGYVLGEFVSSDPVAVYMGEYLITYYCPCETCCEIANRPTASGVMPKEGRTIAADPSIPFGTKIMIDGVVYTVEDRGGLIKGEHIDIFLTDHNRCLKQKSGTVPVYRIL